MGMEGGCLSERGVVQVSDVSYLLRASSTQAMKLDCAGVHGQSRLLRKTRLSGYDEWGWGESMLAVNDRTGRLI
jgi:hypothetical protein